MYNHKFLIWSTHKGRLEEERETKNWKEKENIKNKKKR